MAQEVQTVTFFKEVVPDIGWTGSDPEPGGHILGERLNAIADAYPLTPDEAAEEQAHAFQAQSEGVDVTDNVTAAWGKSYPIGKKIGLMPLMRFAHAAKKGMDTSDMEALAAIYDMLKDCIHPDQWERFELEATEACADAEQLMPIVGDVIAMISARPTQPPIDSSNGRNPITPDSTGTQSDRARAMGLVPVSEL
jgi:hypothetical protein